MSNLAVGIQFFLQGAYTLLAIAVVLDAGSPSVDLRRLPDWNFGPSMVVAAMLATLAVILGLMMHTLSRHIYRKYKDEWALRVLMSNSVRRRCKELNAEPTLQRLAGVTLSDIENSEGQEQIRKAGEVLHAMDYDLLIRAAHVHAAIQTYRHQYRFARGLIIPSIALAVMMPFWTPVAAIPSGVSIGPFNLVAIQLFMLLILLGALAFIAFRERSFRYEAARTRAFFALLLQDQ